jgi:hypothetical protein
MNPCFVDVGRPPLSFNSGLGGVPCQHYVTGDCTLPPECAISAEHVGRFGGGCFKDPKCQGKPQP